MEVRSVPYGVAFTATIGAYDGLFYKVNNLSSRMSRYENWRAGGSLIALSVTRDAFVAAERARVPFGMLLEFSETTEVRDYRGPLDLELKVKGWSPKRPPSAAASHVALSGSRKRWKLTTGERAINIREGEPDGE